MRKKLLVGLVILGLLASIMLPATGCETKSESTFLELGEPVIEESELEPIIEEEPIVEEPIIEEDLYGNCYLDCSDIGGSKYPLPSDTFIYEEDRGLSLQNPTYQELIDFLTVDETDKQDYEVIYWVWSKETDGKKEYITEAEVEELKAVGCGDYYTEYVFACTDFALMLRENANSVGWRCACVALPWFHTINAFETSDKGLVWYGASCEDPTNFGEPMRDRYDPYWYPFGYGDESQKPENQRDEPMEGIIVYVW